MNFEILDKNNLQRWQKILTRFPKEKLDIYFTPNYYRTWVAHEDAEPFCIYAKCTDTEFLYPFFKKEINRYGLNGVYYDIYTAYGYGGVISNCDSIPKYILNKFNARFDDWCKEEGVVAEFIRESPLVNEKQGFVREAEYSVVRQNVYVKINKDYTISSDGAKKSIKRAIKSNLVAEIDDKLKTVKDFAQLYNPAVKRLKMDKYYLFPQDYYDNVIKFLSGNAKIINIRLNNEIIASAFYLHYSDKGSYHLAASNPDFRKFCSNDLLLKTMIDHSVYLGKNILTLGGGTTNDSRDSLFVFKSKFGNMIKDVYIGKRIHDSGIYNKLCNIWLRESPDLQGQYKNFFLKYRIIR